MHSWKTDAVFAELFCIVLGTFPDRTFTGVRDDDEEGSQFIFQLREP
jgi:hypothetical protein